MQAASGLLSQDEMLRVNEAADAAQDKTSARIVPVIATSSGQYERAEDMMGLWAAALGLALTWLAFSWARAGEPWAPVARVQRLGLLVVLGAIASGFLIGALLAKRIGWLKRLFVPRRKQAENVLQRAHQIYGNWLLRHRVRGETVLVYVSLYERRAVVVASEAARENLDAAQLDSAEQAIATSLTRRPCEALCEGIEQIGEILSRHLPAPRRRRDRRLASVITVD